MRSRIAIELYTAEQYNLAVHLNCISFNNTTSQEERLALHIWLAEQDNIARRTVCFPCANRKVPGAEAEQHILKIAQHFPFPNCICQALAILYFTVLGVSALSVFRNKKKEYH